MICFWFYTYLILILYEYVTLFTYSLRVPCIYASLRNAQLFRKENATYLRIFTQMLKIRKFIISCCVRSYLLRQKQWWSFLGKKIKSQRSSKTLLTYINLYSLERSMKRPFLLLRLQITLKRSAKNVKSNLLQSRHSANFESRNPYCFRVMFTRQTLLIDIL